jgi:phage terminase large subunit-like protein
MNKNIFTVTFIEKCVRKSELGRPFRLMPHQKEILELAFAFNEDGRLPYDTVIFSCPKKSGKTTLNAALTLWWALT